jgi:hypothetical protein
VHLPIRRGCASDGRVLPATWSRWDSSRFVTAGQFEAMKDTKTETGKQAV